MKVSPLATPDHAEPTHVRIAEIIGDLVAVLTDENRLLARGLPASLSETTERKLALAEELERLMEMSTSRRPAAAPHPELRARLIQGLAEARQAASENSARLAAALEASRRRIAAVMAAIREQAANDSHAYGANGRRPIYAAPGTMTGGRLV